MTTMEKKKKKKKSDRIPDVIWRVYKNRAQTLISTTISLLPQPPPPPLHRHKCREQQRCLACCGVDPLSYILRPDDPSDYKKLLTKAYAVVADDAPNFDGSFFRCRWSQKRIVTWTIETIGRGPRTGSRNVICTGYKEWSESNKIVDLLATSAWELFHTRIGDDLMLHLLRFASIFLPVERKRHHQVSGLPINQLFSKIPKDVSTSAPQQPLSDPAELSRKRKRTNNADNFNTVENASSKKWVRQPSWLRNKQNQHARRGRKRKHSSIVEEKEDFNGKCEENIINNFKFRPSRRIKLLASDKKHSFSTFSEGVSCQCFCSWMLQTQQKVPLAAQIDRQCIFYRSHPVSSLFPRQHILNKLKANDSSAVTLFKEIFGVSDENLMSLHDCHFCLKRSACLFHSIIRLIKNLIYNSRRCRCQKFIARHCSHPTFQASTVEQDELMVEDGILQNEQQSGIGFQMKSLLPAENLNCHDKRMQQIFSQTTSIGSACNSTLNRSYCHKSQVVSFVWAVCRNIVPVELLGTPSNWVALRRNITKLIHLRRFEKFSLKQCMHGLKSSCVPLLSHKHSCYLNNHMAGKSANMLNGCQKFSDTIATLKHNLLSCWVYWLFSSLVVPIVQANFYVTETEDGKSDVFYYLKTSWKKLLRERIAYLREHNYNLLSNTSVHNIIRERAFGFSKVRFSPKETGVRVLANLKAPSRFKFRGKTYTFRAVNEVLRELNAVLKGLKIKHPEMLGSSVFDYYDVYKKLFPFVVSLKSGSTKMPGVFIAICDISNAFDFVNQDKLLAVMDDVLLDDEYVIEFSSEVSCSKKSLWAHCDQVLMDRNISTTTRNSTKLAPFYVLHSVQVNQETTKTTRKEKLYRDLCEHVKSNVLQVEDKFYLQKVGIPQGSVLSTLLCSYYYADLETKVIFPFLNKIQEHHTSNTGGDKLLEQFVCQDHGAAVRGAEPNCSTPYKHVLLRYVDDFLFISTSKELATSFFKRMQRGFHEYNCFINEGKSCMNFALSHESVLPMNRVYTGEDGISFLPWGGLLINFRTMEIQADYTRYFNVHMSSTLTVCWQDNPGYYLKERLCHYLHPKCHPIFYDSNINSASVVRLNVYQAFLLCSMKFHCYVCSLSSLCTLHAKQYFDMITHSLRYMYDLIKRRVFSPKVGSAVRPVLKLKKKEVVWLGLKAYIRVLERKYRRHSQLLSLLRSELLRFDVGESASLKYATDDSHNSLFWKIKF